MVDLLEKAGLFSPHAWGWSGKAANTLAAVGVLPTRVGMVRSERAATA